MINHKKISETERWEITNDDGVAVCRLYVRKYVDKMWEMSGLKTMKRFRGQGYAEKLLKDVVNHYSDIELKVCACPIYDKAVSKTDLLKFYTRLGFIHKIGTEGIMFINKKS